MGKQLESMTTRRQFLDLAGDRETWEDRYIAMEERYPVGIILHAATEAKAGLLRSAALNASDVYGYAITTSVRPGDGDYLLYIAQL